MPQHPHIADFLEYHANPVEKLAYLANPYYHEDASVMSARERATALVSASLVNQGIPHISPVLYTAPLARLGASPPQGWYLWDAGILVAAEQVILLQLPGWEESRGVQLELYAAAVRQIPVVHMPWSSIKPLLDADTIRTLEQSADPDGPGAAENCPPQNEYDQRPPVGQSLIT